VRWGRTDGQKESAGHYEFNRRTSLFLYAIKNDMQIYKGKQNFPAHQQHRANFSQKYTY
jgi:hypothetical protein